MSHSRSQRLSRKMESSTVHNQISGIPSQPRSSRRSRNSGLDSAPSRGTEHRARDIRKSSARTNRQASRGVVDYVTPSTRTRETQAEYSRRMGSKGLSEATQKNSMLRRILFAVLIVAILAVVAFVAGTLAFNASVGNNMAFSDKKVSEALVAPKEGQPYYILVSSDLNPLDGNLDGVDYMLLIRADEKNKALSMISIPGCLQVRFTDKAYHRVCDASSNGGESEIISGMAGYLGIDIAHYLRVDAKGLADIVDYFGGVDVALSEEMDDPAAGNSYLPVGKQLVTGGDASTLLRAQNYYGGIEMQFDNQGQFCSNLLGSVLALGESKYTEFLDRVSGDIKTDMSADALRAWLKAFSGVGASSIQYGYAPGYYSNYNGVRTYNISETSFKTVWSQFTGGQAPRASEQVSTDVNPADYEITVRNGSGLDGGATKIADILTAAGFNVVEKGNADSFVYEETLVIYRDPVNEPAANAIVKALGCGRTVYDVSFYVYEGDLLVVLGSDWNPVN